MIGSATREGLGMAMDTQTGGMCAAIAVGLEDGYHLLVTDDDPLRWERCEHGGWLFPLYPLAETSTDAIACAEHHDDGVDKLLGVIRDLLRDARAPGRRHRRPEAGAVTGDPRPFASRFVIAASWWVASEPVRSNLRLKLIETHPGGGQYDCLSLVEAGGRSWATLIDLNGAGSMHVHRVVEGRPFAPLTWDSAHRSDDAHVAVRQLEAAAGLTPPAARACHRSRGPHLQGRGAAAGLDGE